MNPSRKPAEVFDPREFCRDEMAFRGLTDANVTAVVRRWLDGERPMSPLVAQALSALFATSQAFWLNLDESYRGEHHA